MVRTPIVCINGWYEMGEMDEMDGIDGIDMNEHQHGHGRASYARAGRKGSGW
jgi:hypothetical protein